MAGWLEARTAMVTGAGSGIGRASALALAAAGAEVAVVDRDPQAGAETVRLVEETGGRSRLILADMTRAEDAKAAVEAVLDWSSGSRLDAAHNNVGITGPYAPLADYDEQDWDRVVATNLKSVFLGMKYQIPPMVAQGSGAIVNTSSGAGLVGFAGLPAYVASKHGVIGATRAAAIEYAKAGVRINAVCPGSTRTPMLEGFMGGD
ncbi:MAG TPA: SDR family NAD(P)-dependent oxidoreductase, partial [Acidimicrobiales bacterium]|nr:SDR family NAD(P)-dependent oxidoreductase [Acidimicrobiales bacterium]